MYSTKLIYICGLIGSGKSTILKGLIKYCDVILEPLEEMLPLLSDPINSNIVLYKIKCYNIIMIFYINIKN